MQGRAAGAHAMPRVSDDEAIHELQAANGALLGGLFDNFQLKIEEGRSGAIKKLARNISPRGFTAQWGPAERATAAQRISLCAWPNAVGGRVCLATRRRGTERGRTGCWSDGRWNCLEGP